MTDSEKLISSLLKDEEVQHIRVSNEILKRKHEAVGKSLITKNAFEILDDNDDKKYYVNLKPAIFSLPPRSNEQFK